MASSNVTNTSVVPSVTVGTPYYDDFNELKNFYRWVFRPGLPVQARELTQIQTYLQSQIERFGRHVFTEGSLVQGGQISFTTNRTLNLQTTYAETDIDVNDLIGNKIIFSSGNNTVQAQVITGKNAEGDDPPVIMVKYLTGQEFEANATIVTANTTSNSYAIIASSNAVANGISASIQDGIFFTQGFFTRSGRQTTVVSKYNTSANARVGLEYTESIITDEDDSSLKNPVQESGNYFGPGASRYKIELVLGTRTLDSTDDSKFIELLRLKNGQRDQYNNIPIYSELEETFARRTFDESGNYTVKPFNIQLKDSSNSANIIVNIDPGKAYIFGYEFETVSPTAIEVPRARDTTNVSNYDVLTSYGNYVVGANTNGFFDVSTMPSADIHCVVYSDTVNSNTNTYNSTKIGTTRIRNISYEDAYDTTDGSTHLHRYYIFDSRFNKLTGNATGGSSNTIALHNSTISAVDEAYTGAYVRLIAGPGNGDLRQILSYNGATKTATVDSNFTSTPLANTQYSLEFSIKDAESFIIATAGSSYTANVNIDTQSKLNSLSNGDVAIAETDYNSLLFRLPNSYVAANTGLHNYSYRKVFTARTFTAGVGTITAGTGETPIGTGTLSDTIALDDYVVIVTDAGTSGFSVGDVISFTASGRSISVSGSTVTFDANDAGDFEASILATLQIDSGSETNPKSKTLITANTTHFVGGASNGSFISGSTNCTTYLVSGQAYIQSPTNIVGTLNSVYVSDVKEITAIYDLNGGIATTGLSLSAYTDVSSKYTLDTGQRDNFYDHGGIKLKSGVSAPIGPLVVCFNYYQHGSGTSDGKGFFCVDSYPNASDTDGYRDIPTYISTVGDVYPLSDTIDFRPSRQNASNTSPNFTLNGVRIPTPNEEYTLNYDYYLPRYDILVLYKNREFGYLQGTSGLRPQRPKVPQNSMVLYKLDMTPFTSYSQNVNIHYVENKRYTMRDIGTLETRIKNLEYYQTLSTLEKSASSLTIRDADGLERTKYGIIADNFDTHGFGDVSNPDFKCSLDFSRGILRAPNRKVHNKMFVKTGSGYQSEGSLLTISYSNTALITQNLASKSENVQPYSIARFKGYVRLSPDGDNWINTNHAPDVVINPDGTNDAYEVSGEPYETEWGDWERISVGTETSSTVENRTNTIQYTEDSGDGSQTNVRALETTRVQINYTYEVETLVRTGIQRYKDGTTKTIVEYSTGERVIDVSIVPYVRPNHFLYKITGMRPSRDVWYYFDDVYASDFVMRPNKLVIESNTTMYVDVPGSNERIYTGSNSANLISMSKDIRGDGNNILYVWGSDGEFVSGETITGASGGATAIIKEYYHYSGNAANTGTTTTIELALGASNTANYYAGNTLYIVTGTGRFSNAEIQSYNAETRICTLSSALSAAPTTNSVYSIGQHKIDDRGILAGVTFIPDKEGIYAFRNGQKLFRAIDERNDDLDNATTVGETRYTALGLIQTKNQVSTGTKEPEIVEVQVSQTKQNRRLVGYDEQILESTISDIQQGDPLAQTFTVPRGYTDGVFIDSIDLCFKSKDAELPIWVEIRPTVNGYPHSSIIMPYASATLFPEDVNISDSPNLSDSSTYTRFKFHNPIYLEAGKEYSYTVVTDSLNYEAYVAELGKPIIGSDRLISTQPYVGSMFKSQNASTWTAFQFEDMMFRLNRCVFDTSATVYFNHVLPTSNTPMDWMYLDVNDLVISNTKIDYEFKSSTDSGVLDSTFASVINKANYKNSVRKLVDAGDEESINLKAVLTSTSDAVAPMIDTSRVGIIAIENIINNAGLSNTQIVLDNAGTGYSNAANISIVFSGGGATETANAYVSSVANGSITGIIVDSNGAGYLSDASISFVCDEGSGANAIISSETSTSGGPAKARYITRKVLLKEGFDAGDIRIFITAYKPLGTEINCYYKVKSSDDFDSFEEKEYVKMVSATPSSRYSSTDGELIEFEYRPSLSSNTIVYSSNTGTFNSFNTFAIKLVMTAQDTITIPLVKDIRAIALPGTE